MLLTLPRYRRLLAHSSCAEGHCRRIERFEKSHHKCVQMASKLALFSAENL